MTEKVETLLVVPYGETPTLEDVENAVVHAIRNECVVELKWHVEYSGNYSRYICKDDDPKDVFNCRIPKIYGV